MSQTPRYSGPGRKGLSRPLTDLEHAEWRAATSRWHETPPWTPENEADNEAVREMLILLFEDGVSLPTLARAAGWGIPRISGIKHRLQEQGRLSGQRRYIAPPVPQPRAPKEPISRALTEDESMLLVQMYGALPQQASGTRLWRNQPGDALLATLNSLATDRVTLDALGTALGATRQAVHQHLARFRAEQDAPVLAAA
jgi:hypothetical protein